MPLEGITLWIDQITVDLAKSQLISIEPSQLRRVLTSANKCLLDTFRTPSYSAYMNNLLL